MTAPHEGREPPAVSSVAVGVIFDMDGVLIDSAGAHLESWRRLAAERGGSVSEELFHETFGRQNRDIVPLLFGAGLDETQVAALGERKEELYREIVRGDVPAIDGAVDLVRDCHAAGFKLAIGSSGPPANVRLVLEELNVASCFAALVTGADVTNGKPDPEVFRCAADRLAIPPGRCVVIEDAPSGIEAALLAGMAALGLTTTQTGLIVKAALDTNRYDTAVKVTQEQLKRLRLTPHRFHGDWNYRLRPCKRN